MRHLGCRAGTQTPQRRPYAASRTPQISANPALASICGVQQADDESGLQVINHLPGLLQQAKGNPSKGTPHFYANPGKALKCGLPNATIRCQLRKGTPMRTSRCRVVTQALVAHPCYGNEAATRRMPGPAPDGRRPEAGPLTFTGLSSFTHTQAAFRPAALGATPPPYAGHQMRVSGRIERVSSSALS